MFLNVIQRHKDRFYLFSTSDYLAVDQNAIGRNLTHLVLPSSILEDTASMVKRKPEGKVKIWMGLGKYE